MKKSRKQDKKEKKAAAKKAKEQLKKAAEKAKKADEKEAAKAATKASQLAEKEKREIAKKEEEQKRLASTILKKVLSIILIEWRQQQPAPNRRVILPILINTINTTVFFQNWFLKSCDLIGQAIFLADRFLHRSSKVQKTRSRICKNLLISHHNPFCANQILIILPATAGSESIHFLNTTNWESLEFELPTKKWSGIIQLA